MNNGSLRHIRWRWQVPTQCKPIVLVAFPKHEQQTTSQSVRAPNVNSVLLDKMLKIEVMVVQELSQSLMVQC
jgi:cytochrome bd-type quinol oxidase subunit 1